MVSPFGVYVHVPFCRHRCDYCAFATYTDRDHLMEAYACACAHEIGRAVERDGMTPATSVFFGVYLWGLDQLFERSVRSLFRYFGAK